MSSPWTGKHVAVLGAGRSGHGSTRLLLHLGARVTLTDSRTAEQLGDAPPEPQDNLELALGGHPDDLWQRVDAVVTSPGIDPNAPPLRAARAAGHEVLSEIELAAPFAGAPCAAITGSNGKSTVTAMTGAILAAAGIDAPTCGNIGVAFAARVTEALESDRYPDLYVLELSSFQTEFTRAFRPRWAALLNVTADHLDRHGDFDSYARAKLAMTRNQEAGDWFVYGADDPWIASHVPAGPVAVPFGATSPEAVCAAWTDGNALWWRDGRDSETRIMGTDELSIVGRHNELNAAAAIAIATLAGAAAAQARSALRDFHGLEHRMERCGTIDGVLCINDSKATNVGATIAALSGLDQGAQVILGGRDKNSDFGLLVPYLQRHARGVWLVGEAAPRIAAVLDGDVPTRDCGDLEGAVDAALGAAESGEVLLLAPACTSFDQYENFEERGKHFRALIAARAASV